MITLITPFGIPARDASSAKARAEYGVLTRSFVSRVYAAELGGDNKPPEEL